jgi:hypothetical protein
VTSDTAVADEAAASARVCRNYIDIDDRPRRPYDILESMEKGAKEPPARHHRTCGTWPRPLQRLL